jgi:uridine phosphorylase
MVLIDRALRGEGTSAAYMPPAPEICAPAGCIGEAGERLGRAGIAVIRGASWTTDAPFRETETALARARADGALVVEMEAAALYAFAVARDATVVCFAHVTNSMAVTEFDFEKGASNGAEQALALVLAMGST